MRIVVVCGLLGVAATCWGGFAYGTFARAAAIERQRMEAEQVKIRATPAVPPLDDSSAFMLVRSEAIVGGDWSVSQ